VPILPLSEYDVQSNPADGAQAESDEAALERIIAEEPQTRKWNGSELAQWRSGQCLRVCDDAGLVPFRTLARIKKNLSRVLS